MAPERAQDFFFFLTEHKWIDPDAEVALAQPSFKAISGDTKKNTTEEAGLTIILLLSSQIIQVGGTLCW